MKNDYAWKNRVRPDHSEMVVDYFRNDAAFDTESKNFLIFVDPEQEYYRMQELIRKWEANPEPKISLDDEAELNQLRADKESDNSVQRERAVNKYRISFDSVETTKANIKRDNSDTVSEPFINIYSGAKVELNYGEGLLDFIYADFQTPLKKELSLSALFEKMSKLSSEVYHMTDSTTHEVVEDFYDYEATFSVIKGIAYASLYSAICPPKFDSGFIASVMLKQYGSYLLNLQKEYRELIEFCFDETLYPDALGKLFPSERYALYRRHRHLPASNSRQETVSFSTKQMGGDAMPYGMDAHEFIMRISAHQEQTPDHIDLAEKLGITPGQLIAETQVPQFMSVSYRFGSVAEILELEFTKMLESNIRFRKCKRCGKYFIMKGNYDTNYCDRVTDGETRNCQELAAVEKHKAKIADDKAIPIYNKYYKRYAARLKVRQIKEADFKKWKYQAITMRDECSAGKITVNEYVRWMEDSFPNRKPKT